MKSLSYILPFLILLAACDKKADNKSLPFYNTPDFTPVWLIPQDEAYSKIHKVAAFNLTNQLGDTISTKNTAGKIYVANFFFASCQSVCPPMMENLSKVAQVFEKDDRVLILSHSVTPRRDSVPVLFKYAQQRHINNSKWWLLTGDQPAIYKLARQAYFADDATGYTKGSDDFLHTENLVLIDTKGRIRGVYNGSLQLEVNNLIDDIKLLEAEDI
ncbi:MAG: SCO family protein [Sphingobacteriaceae bacterium]|nr:MAG: SCO family protein [Sphingobacteriaceae bacterium]